ncbi:MAG: hypothetical protein FWD24_04780 [Treponema sp.]|nr:hypothetical protein [Treponema sp.]
MIDFNNAIVADFGKIVFVPKNHSIPALPDMNLIIFKKENEYQAICIDIEIDAVGDNLKDACNNLKKVLRLYITQMVYNYNGNINSVVEDIINNAFSHGNIKSQLFEKYLQAKHKYLLDKIANDRKAKSRKDDVINAWHRIFQIEPIRLNLTLAAGIA